MPDQEERAEILVVPLHPNIDTSGASHAQPPQPEPCSTSGTPKAGSQAQVCMRAHSQAAFLGGRESILAAQAEGGSWESLPSPAGWEGAARQRGCSAVGARARRSELCRGYHSPAQGCRALKEMFLFMQRCQISSASWHWVTAFMPPCLSLLTPISFYHRAVPGSFSAGFMFQPDCV